VPCHKRAERVVRRRDRVRGVTSLITVRPRVKPSPADLKRRNEAALVRNAERITLDLQGHKVIPKGSVRSRPEKQEAQRVACSAWGVTSFDPRHPFP
jgi:osmotically-inducible protein OsmY